MANDLEMEFLFTEFTVLVNSLSEIIRPVAAYNWMMQTTTSPSGDIILSHMYN